jgi:two-component system response regulator NreC
MTKIQVLIADDHTVLRSGLKMLLNEQPDISVTGEANDGNEAITKAIELKPDVLLLDITMPGLGGIDVIKTMKLKMPQVFILVLTMHEDDSYLTEALKAGASGYIPKKAADTELIAAIRTVSRGEVFIHSSLTKSLVKRIIQVESPNKELAVDSFERLSQREHEILTSVAQGYTNQQIAKHLYLSVKTVETYKARVMEKLDLHSRVELVRFALKRGLLANDTNCFANN